MLGSILWAIIVALLIFWIIGAFFANLGNIVWIALVVAVILIVYNLLTSGRAEV
ncbi:MAG TPA: lmo0937 family membrane protein [Chloroflexota bacterium]|nr:lmo0937 family membrane protein [Chloroflexota bacterium]HEX2988937.1 lmo0937 family membrane protein [Chloroflexota bacterium]